jgi:AAHS family 4-hydroxybenzoate transporter-like MFS transporter
VTTPPSASHDSAVDIGELLDGGAFSGYQRLLVALTAITVIFDGADNQLLGASLPVIMREWQLPRAAFAPALAAGLFGMILGGGVAGVFGDRSGRKRALLVSVLVFGVATASVGFAATVPALALLRFIAGLGLGGALPNAGALAAEFVPRQRRTIAVTLAIVCVPLGGTVAALLAVHMLPTVGWRGFFQIVGGIPIALALLLAWTLPESPRYLAQHPDRAGELHALVARMGHRVGPGQTIVDRRERNAGGGVRALLSPDYRRDTVLLWAAFFACLLSVYLGFNWIPAMLTGAGLPAAVAGTGLTANNLAGVAGALGGALAFPRFGSKRVMLGLAAAATVSAIVAGWLPITPARSTLSIVATIALVGAFTNAVQTTLYALATHVYPTPMRATGLGAALSIGRIGAVLSSYAGTAALDRGGPFAFFLLTAVAMLVVFGALAALQRHLPPGAAAKA